MDWDLDQEHLGRCRQFASEVMLPRYREFDIKNAFPESVHEEAYRWGLMDLLTPVEFGGRGMRARDVVAGFEILATVCAPTTFSMMINNGAVLPVTQAGTPEQKQLFVKDLIERHELASVCLTELEVGSNLFDLSTAAVQTADGWTLTGTKVMVGNGTAASLYIVLANAMINGKSMGPTYFAVPRGPGVVVGENTDKLGFRPVPTPTIAFNDVQLTELNRIGPVGGGANLLFAQMNASRLAGGSMLLGITEGALRDALEWVENRSVAGGRLIDKSHVRIMLGQFSARQLAIRALITSAAIAYEHGEPCAKEAAAAKMLAAELAADATAAIVQLFGWRGIDNDYPIQKRFRDARQGSIFEGTDEIQAMLSFGYKAHAIETEKKQDLD